MVRRSLSSRFPARRGQVFIETPEGQTYSYADLEATSGRFARLLGDLGVQPGDRVAVQVDKSPEAIFLYLATLRAGAVYLPLNTAYTRSEIAYFLSDARPTLFVCRPEDEAEAAEAAREAGVPAVLTLGAEGDGSLIEAAAGLDPDVGCVASDPGNLAAPRSGYTIAYTAGEDDDLADEDQ